MTPNRSAEASLLLANFLKNREKDLLVLAESMATGSFEVVSRLGHAMHGSGGTYGFEEISEIGMQLELAAQAEDQASIEASVKLLRQVLDRAS